MFHNQSNQSGQIDCETCPNINADDVVGAIALRVTFLLPYPFKYSGSPYFCAISSDALYDFSLISLNTSTFNFALSLVSNANPLDCKSECHPKTPKPNALCLLAKLYAFSIYIKALLPSIVPLSLYASILVQNSVTTASKK